MIFSWDIKLATNEMGDKDTVFNILSAKNKINLRRSVFRSTLRQVIVSTIVAAIVVIADRQGFINKPTSDLFNPAIILGLFIFRFYLAHSIFSESYKLWYGIIDASRIVCRNISIVIPVNNPEELRVKRDYLRLVCQLIGLIKLDLQHKTIDVDPQMRILLSNELYSELQTVDNAPSRVVNLLAEYFHRVFYVKKIIDPELFIDLNRSLDRLTTIFSDCQRISNTNISGYFLIYFRYYVIFYTFILPCQLVQELEWVTIPIVGIISYVLLGVEDAIVKIENPFHSQYHQAYLDKICENFRSEIDSEWIEYSSCKTKFSDRFNR
jgi:ion channel-forming bestrophin family protein